MAPALEADGKDVYWSQADSYRRSLTSIEEIRTVAGKITLELPQIVVIGNQSSGKSSLLSSLSSVKFPEGSGTCTKCPVVLSLRRSKKEYFAVADVECKQADMTQKIKEAHISRSSSFSEEPITLEIHSPKQIDLTLVYLPGIIYNEAEIGVQLVKNMTIKYIKPPSSITLVVREATSDEQLHQAILMAKSYDPTEVRTLQVLTKCDVFSEEALKEEAKALLEREMSREHGAHAVCCRISGKDTLMQKEICLLKDTFGSKYAPRLGVEKLKVRLIQLLGQCIRLNYRKIREKITTKEVEAKAVLEKLGAHAPSPSEIMYVLSSDLGKETDSLRKKITKHLEDFSSKIRETKKDITEENAAKYLDHDCFCPPVFQGREAFDKMVYAIATELWEPIIKENSIAVLEEARSLTFKGFYQKVLEDRVMASWNEKWLQLETRTCRFIKELTSKVSKFGTANHYFSADHEELVIGTKFVDESLDTVTDELLGEATRQKNRNNTYGGSQEQLFRTYIQTEEIIRNLKEHVSTFVEKKMEAYNRSSLKEQQVKKIQAYVMANWRVEHKTYIDDYLKFIRDNIVEEYEEWTRSIRANPGLAQYANEPESVKRERQEAVDQCDKMRECSKRIVNLEDLS